MVRWLGGFGFRFFGFRFERVVRKGEREGERERERESVCVSSIRSEDGTCGRETAFHVLYFPQKVSYAFVPLERTLGQAHSG